MKVQNDNPKHQPRDLIGYGANPPHAQWPNKARVAVQFVINYEEGAENCILDGDQASESFLSDMIGTPPIVGQRHMSMEWLYEYGSRCGFWRLINLFKERGMKGTIFAVALALEKNPDVVKAMQDANFEIASHGYRWINYQYASEELEYEHIEKAVEIHERVTGKRPLGWYTGRNSPRTRQLVAKYGGFLYDADSYADELPYWELVNGKPELIVPYTLECNDMKFAALNGFVTSEDFYNYLKDTFDVLYKEGATAPKMMSVGLHCRIVGKPGRAKALERFLDYLQGFDDVWVCTREEIAKHWRETHPYQEK